MTARLLALLWSLSCPSVPFDKRSSEISGGTTLLHPKKSAPSLIFSFSPDGEGLNGIISLSPTGFLVYLYFIMFYAEVEHTIEVIEEFVSNVPSVFN